MKYAALLLLCAQTAFAQSQSPRLIVLITVDQLRADYLTRYHDEFSAGLRMLMDKGAVFTNAFQDHAVTQTAVGHASLLSGRFPRQHGIVSNRRGVPDPQFRVIGDTGAASPYRFRGSTLIDWLRVRDPGSRALSASFKDRSAIMPLGRAKQSVFWFSDIAKGFTTSTYYADTLPGWVVDFNRKRPAEVYANPLWPVLRLASQYSEPDTVEIENERGESTFPHTKVTFRRSPFADEVLAAFALKALDALQIGKTGHVDLLSVSFSATDEIGHRFGPQSREIHDQMLRLDVTLGAFLDSLYARFAPHEIIVALSSDHGVSPFPALMAPASAKPGSWVVDTLPAIRAARSVLKGTGVPDTAIYTETGLLIVNPQLFGYNQSLIDSAVNAFVRVARQISGIQRVDYVRDITETAARKNPILRRWYNALPPDVPIPVVLTIAPGHTYGVQKSAQHGTPHDLDAWVPIIFYGPQFRAGRYTQFTRTVDIAPTLAHVLNLKPTERLDGKPLTQILK
jgi:hypothetical protein